MINLCVYTYFRALSFMSLQFYYLKNAYFSEMENQNVSNSFFRYPYLCIFTCNLCQYEYISSNIDILTANYCF